MAGQPERPGPQTDFARRAAAHRPFDPALLNGVQVIEGKGYNVTTNEFGHTVKRLQDFKVIPYFAWANRGPGEMIVWDPNSESVLRAP